jgi:hypothetical protein
LADTASVNNHFEICFLSQNWMDYQLNWNTTEYGGVKSIRIHPKFIWTPDLLMYNRLVFILIYVL